MAKRFTDTEKWKDEWWGSLSNDYRMIWLYLVDSCSIAGIWKKDFRGLNFNCNVNITEKEFNEVFKDRVIDKGNFYFLPKFIRFQYPKGLNSNKPAIVSVVKELQLNNLLLIVNELLGNDYLIIKDKDKDMVKDKETDKEKEFRKQLNFYVPKFSQETIDSFYNNWAQIGKDGKMKWEHEKIFDIPKRLATWYGNERKWAKEKEQKMIEKNKQVVI